jgi:hypothetical protein
MRGESRYLRSHGRARRAVKEIVEMHDQQADRVMRSIEENQGKLTGALAKEIRLYPGLANANNKECIFFHWKT